MNPDDEDDEEPDEEPEEPSPIYIDKLQEINGNLSRLFNNDLILEKNIQDLSKTKEISISDMGICVKSINPFEDINIILKNKNIKKFIGIAREKRMLKNISYIA